MLRYPELTKTGRTMWCGPFAVAVLTGLDYDSAYAKVLDDTRRGLMRVRRQRAERVTAPGHKVKVRRGGLPTVVKGIEPWKLARVLGKLGVRCEFTKVPTKQRLTLITFARDHTVKGKTYAVDAGDHFMVIRDGILYHAHHLPMPVDEAPAYRMARVRRWAEVRPRPEALAA